MRVALVSPYDLTVPGGVQAHVRALAVELHNLGDEVLVLGPGAPDSRPTLSPAPRAGARTRGTDVEEVLLGPSRSVPFNGSRAPLGLNPRMVRRTRAALARFAPDVIHVHEPLVPTVGLAAARSGIAPTIATFHAWSQRDRGYRLARPLGRRVLAGLAAAVAVSDAAAGYHAGALGVPARTFRVIPNGVEVGRFADAEPFPEVVSDPRPRLLFVGRLEPRKGLETLVRAYTRLKTEHPEVRLEVVGAGSEQHRCAALLPARLGEDVTFHGRVADDDLPRWYASCDLYVSPALGGESFGIVLLEAMAAGCPVVASDLPGYRSVATDGAQARLVPPGDPAALATAIGALLDAPALREALAREGRRHVAAFDWPVVAARLRERYAEAARA